MGLRGAGRVSKAPGFEQRDGVWWRPDSPRREVRRPQGGRGRRRAAAGVGGRAPQRFNRGLLRPSR